MMNDEQGKRYLQYSLTFLLVAYWLFAHYIERIDLGVNTPSYLQPLAVGGVAQSAVFFVAEMFSPRVLRHLVPFALGWYLAQQATLGLVQDLFDLPSPTAAQSFLDRYVMPDAPPGPALTIRRKEFDKDRLQKPLLRYGGPGKIVVAQGDVVATERNGRFRRVLGPGVHNLHQYEYVRSVLDTRPQQRFQAGIRLYSQDGIEILTDIRINFCLGRGEREPEEQAPFPFEPEDVRLAAYTEIILEDGHTQIWDDMPLVFAMRTLTELASKQPLDRLLYPDNPELNPHELLRERLERQCGRALKAIGITLISIQLSRLEVPDTVTQQRIDHWRAYWQRQKREKEGSGEAEAHLHIEEARTQARVSAIRHLLNEVQSAQGQSVATREVLGMRLLNALDHLTQQSAASPPARELAARIEQVREQLLLGDETAEEQRAA